MREDRRMGWNFHRGDAEVAKGRRAGLGERMGIWENVLSGIDDFFLKYLK